MEARRAGSWARQQARQRHLDFLRASWLPLAGLGALLAAAVTAAVYAVPTSLRGFVAGAGVASAFWYVALVTVQVAGTTRFMLGADGEEWTSSALRKLRRRGWHSLDHVTLRYGDIDHALIGPGGAFAVETKATYDGWDLDHPGQWLRRAADQARSGAERLHHLLASKDCQLRTDVRSLLVVWGPTKGTASRIDGVDVVHGTNLKTWRESLRTDVLTSAEIERAATGLRKLIDARDKDIIKKQGRPPLLVKLGPFGVLTRLMTGFVGGLAAFAALVFPLNLLSPHAALPLDLVIVLLGLAGWRQERLRVLAAGWTATAVALAVLLVGLYGYDALR